MDRNTDRGIDGGTDRDADRSTDVQPSEELNANLVRAHSVPTRETVMKEPFPSP